jgi:hypothetical protein
MNRPAVASRGQPPPAAEEPRFTVRINANAETKGSVIEALAELLVDLWEEEQRQQTSSPLGSESRE